MTELPFDPYKSPPAAAGNEKPADVKRPKTSGALIGAAIVHLVPGILFWAVAGLKYDLNDAIRIGGSLAFLILGIWARWTPLPPAVIALVVYGAYAALQIISGPRNLPLVIYIVHVSIMALLIIAVVSAARRPPASHNQEQ
jgi:hypothetical protein